LREKRNLFDRRKLTQVSPNCNFQPIITIKSSNSNEFGLGYRKSNSKKSKDLNIELDPSKKLIVDTPESRIYSTQNRRMTIEQFKQKFPKGISVK
jgi:hypothetical protein